MLRVFFISTVFVAVLFFLSANNIPHARDIALQNLRNHTFEPLIYVLVFFIGARCLTPYRSSGRISIFFENFSPKIQMLYEGSAGTVLGWGIGTGAASVINDGMVMLPLVVATCCILLLLSMVPLWANESVGRVASKYKNFMPGDRKGMKVIQFCGVSFLIFSTDGMIQWLGN